MPPARTEHTSLLLHCDCLLTRLVPPCAQADLIYCRLELRLAAPLRRTARWPRVLWACGTMAGMAARAAVVVAVAVAAVVLACRCVRACSTVARRGVSVVHVAVLPLLTSPWDLSPSGLAPKNRRRLGGISLGPLLLFKQLPICKTGARGARLRAKYEDARCIATASSISSQPVFCAVERPPPIARQHEHGAVRGVL